MQAPNSNSTLELVVNEQNLQNMSQIDLSRPEDSNQSNRTRQQDSMSGNLGLKHLKEWPNRFREGFNAKMDEAKAKSETKTEFVFELMSAFSGIVLWILCFICTTIIPFILFFIGLLNLDNCQARPSLPYLVFATGFIMTASNIFNLALAIDLPILRNHHILTADIKNIIASIINIIFNCIFAFLYILCCYTVFTTSTHKHYTHSSDEKSKQPGEESIGEDDDSNQCDGLLYHFTFWFVSLTLSLFVVLSCVATVFILYNKYRLTIIRGSTPRSQSNEATNRV